MLSQSSLFWDELYALFSLAWPSLLSIWSIIGVGLVNSVVVGRFSTTAHAAIAYGDVVMEFTLMIVLQGFNMGLRTLCAQAFGAREFHLVGQYIQMSIVGISILCLPLGCIWVSVGWMLQFAHAEEEVVQYASQYGRIAVFSLWPRVIFVLLSSYFSSLQIVRPAAVFATISLICHAFLSWILVHGIGSWSGIGFIGSPISISIVTWMRLLLYCCYMFLYRKLHAQTWPSRWVNSWTHFNNLLWVGGPMMLGRAAEEAQLLTFALMASTLGTAPLAAHNAMIQLVLTCSCPNFGLNVGANIRIGIHLGAGNPESAKLVFRLMLRCSMAWCTFIVILYAIFHAHIGALFTHDENVQSAIQSISIKGVAALSFASLCHVALGTLASQARSVPIFVSFVTGAWVVGVPSGYFLGFVYPGSGLVGIWSGVCLGYFVTASIGVIFVSRSNWTELSRLSQQRAQCQHPSFNDEQGSLSKLFIPDLEEDSLSNLFIPDLEAKDVNGDDDDNPEGLMAD